MTPKEAQNGKYDYDPAHTMRGSVNASIAL